jgi:hypothetical protein
VVIETLVKAFFGIPFKGVVLIAALLVVFALQLNPSLAQETREGRPMLADLVNGGATLFNANSYFLNAKLGQEIVFKIRRAETVPMSITVKVDERKIRYFGSDVYGFPYGGGNVSVRSFHSPLTY